MRASGKLLYSAALLIISCGDDSPRQPAPIVAACPDAHFDTEIPVPAVDTSIVFGQRFSVHTNGEQRGVAVDMEDQKGTVSFGGRGPFQAFIYHIAPWPDIGQTLLEGLGIEDGVWYPFWLFCTPDGRLEEVYGEMTDNPRFVLEHIDGSCVATPEYYEMPVQLPANRLKNVAMTCGFDVKSAPGDPLLDIASSRPGKFDLWGEVQTVVVFATGDCRSGCGNGSWFELHSIVWAPVANSVWFSIWYLDDPVRSGVAAANGVLFPTVRPGPIQVLPNAMVAPLTR